MATAAVAVVVAAALGTLWWTGHEPPDAPPQGGNGTAGSTPTTGASAVAEAAVAAWLVARNSHTPGAVARVSTPDLSFLVLSTPTAWGPTTSPTAFEIFDRLAADPGSHVEVTGSAVMLDDTRVLYRTHVVTPSIGEDASGLAVWSVRDTAGVPAVSHVVWLPDDRAHDAAIPDPVGAATAWLAAANEHEAQGLGAASTPDLVWATMSPAGGAITLLQGAGTPSSGGFLTTAVADAGFRFTPTGSPVAMDGSHVAAVARLVDPAHGSDATGLAVWTLRGDDGRSRVSQLLWLPDR